MAKSLVLMVVVAAIPGVVRAQPACDSPGGAFTDAERCLNHQLCHDVQTSGFQPIGGVTLVDRFGTATVTVRRPERLCAPADKNGEDPDAVAAAEHLTVYPVSPEGRFTTVRNQVIQNQLHTTTVDVSRVSRLLVPAAKSLSAPPSALPPDAIDHFACHRIKPARGVRRPPNVTVTVTDQFGTSTLEVRRAVELCTPANKRGESPGAETHFAQLVCYRVGTSGRSDAAAQAFTTDQFGTRTLQVRRERTLCVPSVLNPGAPTTTTTAAPTTTTTTSSTTTTTLGDVQCCVPSSVGGAFDQCLLVSSAECATQGGIDVGPGTCEPGTCPPGTSTTTSTIAPTTSSTVASTTSTSTTTSTSSTTQADVQCCVPSSVGGAFDQCIVVSAAACAGQGGIDVGPGTCEPGTCPPDASTTTSSTAAPTTSLAPTTSTTSPPSTSSTSTTTTSSTTTSTAPADVQCCVPSSVGGAFDQCIVVSAAACAGQGGIDVGPGTCEPGTCPPDPSSTTSSSTTVPPTTSSTSSSSTTTLGASSTTTSTSVAPASTSTSSTTSTTLGDVQCCVPSSVGGAFDQCIVVSAAACAGQGGIDAGPGTCEPGTCPPDTSSTTTTLTATTSTTSTTAPPTLLLVSQTAGTTNCGGPGLTRHCTNGNPGTDGRGACSVDGDCGIGATPGTCAGGPPPSAPFSGQLDDGSGAKIVDLGLGCFYLGGGRNTTVGGTPAGGAGTSQFALTGAGPSFTVGPDDGTGPKDCTNGAGPARRCISSSNFGNACSTDGDCDSTKPGSCAPDANCYFGPPLAITPPGVCVLNVIADDPAGTLNQSTGNLAVTMPLDFRVYLAACPVCNAGSCSAGQNAGGQCTAQTTSGTTVDCPPAASAYLTTLPLDVPLVTGTSALPPSGLSANGLFCPSQANAGAFGQPFARRILEQGSAAGSLEDRAAHPATLAASFCVGGADALINSAADLPGPAAASIPVTLRVQ